MVETTQSGLLERLRAQRQGMDATSAPIENEPASADAGTAMPLMHSAQAQAEVVAAAREQTTRIVRIEAEHDVVRQRLDSVEANLRAGLAELRGGLSPMVTAEVVKHTTATNEAVADVVGRVGRMETDFTRERERWASIVTSFDQRLDHRLRSFRQDVTVMLAGMAVLVLAMLMLLLMRPR